jgi:hypothetical protein
MENFYTVKKYIPSLISDPLLSPFGHAKQKLQHLSTMKKQLSLDIK